MGRSKSPKSTATREHILAVATKLFQKKGFAKTTMRDIATGAGVALGGAYYYFPTKEAMVQALYDGFSDDLETAMPEILAHATLPERLVAFTDKLFALAQPNREMFAVLAQTILDPRSPLSPLNAATAKPRDAAIDRFRRMLPDGSDSLPPAQRTRVPVLLWLWHLAVLAVWVYDESPGQRKSRALRDATAGLAETSLGLLAFGPVAMQVEPVLAFLDDLVPSSPTKKA